ncbi:SusD family protein [Catalinimonas alkaloidigena]|uniref:SusD family protein n=1 Tax=Catalinimonas alkaloidigena TaxID=1075417 RepID=A0A1G9HI76_9BACT|nr:RagB/SusD family nutrient uptake outer membrane protein [Catalinimonas alkaloidigena]SDL12680.1 SusD family protein [Catalinimonas alkaloidigena]
MLAAALTTGCGDKLNIEPQQSIDEGEALSTSENVQAVLVGAYDALGDGDLYGGQLMKDTDLLADDGEVFWSGTYIQPREFYVKSIQTNNANVESTYLAAYVAINIANNVLSALDVVDEAERDRVEGEALFIRGLVYFDLARTYGKAWNDGDPTQNPAVPLVTAPTRTIDESSRVPRNTVAQVYDQAITDLTRAVELLPEENGFFATTYAASAVLARIYLQQQEYGKAAQAANRVIEEGDYALVGNYANAFNNTATSTSEDIFAIQVTTQDGVNSLHTFYANPDNGGRGDIDILPAHLALYEEGDERLSLFYVDDPSDPQTLVRTGKWKNQYGNVPLIRLAEMYLTRAEANLRAGSTVGATPQEDLTVVRERVGLSPTSATLEAILLERKLELAFEGHSLHDTKRTEQAVDDIPFDADRLVYPIPLREVDAAGLQQNPGYGG